jgi:probable HAF family extracellular repeat protein
LSLIGGSAAVCDTIILMLKLISTLALAFFSSPIAGYQLTDLGTISGASSIMATSINNHGTVVGYTNFPDDGGNSAFILERDAFKVLDPLPGGPWAKAYAINDRGLVTGVSAGVFNGTSMAHATLWSGGSAKDLGTLGGYGSQARAINAAGQVAGFSDEEKSATSQIVPFIWSNGAMKALPTLGQRNNFAYGINDRGDVVGSVEKLGWFARRFMEGQQAN